MSDSCYLRSQKEPLRQRESGFVCRGGEREISFQSGRVCVGFGFPSVLLVVAHASFVGSWNWSPIDPILDRRCRVCNGGSEIILMQ